MGQVLKWRALTSYWESETAIRRIQQKLDKLPSEEEATKLVKETASSLLELSGEILRHTWIEQAQAIGNTDIQKAQEYANALKILGGPHDPNEYPHAKRVQEVNFPSALMAFPIWATTNLSTKSNFPFSQIFATLPL